MADQFITEAKKTLCMVRLVNELPVLRACLGLSQKELAEQAILPLGEREQEELMEQKQAEPAERKLAEQMG